MPNNIEKISKLCLLSYTLAETSINAISDLNTLSQLYDKFKGMDVPCYIPNLIESRLEYIAKDTEKEVVHNESISKLIEQLNNKQTEKSAAKQIKQRFLGLDYDVQVMIMEKFLNMSASYRIWCYKTLREWREERFDTTIVQLWKKYKERGCRKLIIECLPPDAVKDIYEELVEGISRKAYFLFIRRFGKEDWFTINKEMLAKPSSQDLSWKVKNPLVYKIRHKYFYLLALSMTNEKVPVEECGEIMYSYFQDLLDEDILKEHIDSCVCCEDSCGYVKYAYDLLHIDLDNIPSPTDFIKCFIKFGHYDFVNGLISWMYSVNRLLPVDKERSADEDIMEYIKKRFIPYCRIAKENMPVNFAGIEDTPSVTYDGINNEMESAFPFHCSGQQSQEILCSSEDGPF